MKGAGERLRYFLSPWWRVVWFEFFRRSRSGRSLQMSSFETHGSAGMWRNRVNKSRVPYSRTETVTVNLLLRPAWRVGPTVRLR